MDKKMKEENLKKKGEKKMESIHRAVLIGVSIGILICSFLILGGYYISCWRQIEMAKAGFEQVQTVGRGDYVWQKIK